MTHSLYEGGPSIAAATRLMNIAPTRLPSSGNTNHPEKNRDKPQSLL